jgi:predicted small lipoprotein YifL
MRYLFSILTAFLLLAGCGRKGPLIPPEALVPPPVNDLAVNQRGEGLLVSWTVPVRDEGGRPVRDLTYFRIFKREVLPPGEDCEVCPDAYRVLREVYPDYPREARRIGDSLYLNDTGGIPGSTYQYKVVSYLGDGTPSPDSNRFRLTKIAPLPGPRLKALSTPTSVILQWDGATLPPHVKAKGYNIYRWRTDDPPAILPLNATPVTASGFEDFRLQRGIGYLYAVRGVADVDGIQVESASSNEVAGARTEPD